MGKKRKKVQKTGWISGQGRQSREYVEGTRKYIEKKLNNESDTHYKDEKDKASEAKQEANDVTKEVVEEQKNAPTEEKPTD